jgi:hypothetical protein
MNSFVLFARIITACLCKGAQWRLSSPEIAHIYISRILLSDRSTSRKRRPARPHIVVTTPFSGWAQLKQTESQLGRPPTRTLRVVSAWGSVDELPKHGVSGESRTRTWRPQRGLPVSALSPLPSVTTSPCLMPIGEIRLLLSIDKWKILEERKTQ